MPYRDPERMREAQRKYREANREKRRETNRKWRRANPEKVRERSRKWSEANPEKKRAASLKWNRANPDALRKANARYCASGKKRVSDRRRKIRKLSQLGSFPIPEPEFIGLLWETDPNCYYCRAPLRALYHVEHKIPLSRPEMKPDHWEGLHDFRNLRLACPSCNLRKGTKTAEEFMLGR